MLSAVASATQDSRFERLKNLKPLALPGDSYSKFKAWLNSIGRLSSNPYSEITTRCTDPLARSRRCRRGFILPAPLTSS